MVGSQSTQSIPFQAWNQAESVRLELREASRSEYTRLSAFCNSGDTRTTICIDAEDLEPFCATYGVQVWYKLMYISYKLHTMWFLIRREDLYPSRRLAPVSVWKCIGLFSGSASGPPLNKSFLWAVQNLIHESACNIVRQPARSIPNWCRKRKESPLKLKICNSLRSCFFIPKEKLPKLKSRTSLWSRKYFFFSDGLAKKFGW